MSESSQKLETARQEVLGLAAGLFSIIGRPFEDTDELERQVLATISFGALNAAGHIAELSAQQAYGLTVDMLTTVFRYETDQARSFAEHLVAIAAGAVEQKTMLQLVHYGIDMHVQYVNNDLEPIRHNILSILDQIRAATPAGYSEKEN